MMDDRMEGLIPQFELERFVERNDLLQLEIDVLVPRSLSGVRRAGRQ